MCLGAVTSDASARGRREGEGIEREDSNIEEMRTAGLSVFVVLNHKKKKNKPKNIK